MVGPNKNDQECIKQCSVGRLYTEDVYCFSRSSGCFFFAWCRRCRGLMLSTAEVVVHLGLSACLSALCINKEVLKLRTWWFPLFGAFPFITFQAGLTATVFCHAKNLRFKPGRPRGSGCKDSMSPGLARICFRKVRWTCAGHEICSHCSQ